MSAEMFIVVFIMNNMPFDVRNRIFGA